MAHQAVKLDTTDWQVALLYYMLCLQLKALGARRGLELQDHYRIKRWLNSDNDLIPVAKPYRKAEEWSRDARYEGRCFDGAEIRRYLSWFGCVYDCVGKLLENEGVPRPEFTDPRSLFDLH